MRHSRTALFVGATLWTGVSCDDCHTPYADCQQRVLASATACCGSCQTRDTHEEQRHSRLEGIR